PFSHFPFFLQKENIFPSEVAAVTIMLSPLTAICGPRVAKENNFGTLAIRNGEEKDLPLSEEQTYITLSFIPYTRWILPALSAVISGIWPLAIIKSVFETALFSLHDNNVAKAIIEISKRMILF